MLSYPPPNPPEEFTLIGEKDFSDWESLNDSIMGGASNASCRDTPSGLSLEGVLVEQGGGFVSCRSPVFIKSLDLSDFSGFVLEVEGEGRTLKFAVACTNRRFGIANFLALNIRWVTELKTKKNGITRVEVPFSKLEPAVRAKPVKLPVRFDKSNISQFQLLHSKFGTPGKLNQAFQPGSIRIVLHSISAYF